MLIEEDAQPLSVSSARSLCLREHTCAVSSPWLFLTSSSRHNVLHVGLALTAAWWEDAALRPHGLQAPHAPSFAMFSNSTENRASPVGTAMGTSFGNSHYLVRNPEPFFSDPSKKPDILRLFLLSEKQLKLVLIYFHASLTLQKL